MIDISSADGVVQVKPFLSVTIGITVLFAGKALNERIALLRNYNIPEPVTGGLLFSILFALLTGVRRGTQLRVHGPEMSCWSIFSPPSASMPR